MGAGSRGKGRDLPGYNSYKVERGLMVLFFGLVFSIGSPLEIFLPTPLNEDYARA